MVLSDVTDPMYWLGSAGPLGLAVLPAVMLVVFIETGFLFPFLPGDTLLFSAGLIAAQPHAPIGIWTLAPCAALAATLGSQCGYVIGRKLGPALFRDESSRFFKPHYLETSHQYFEKYGPKILLIAQFIGVVRTFTPVVAGMSAMRYPVFLAFNAAGSIAWGFGMSLLGYFLGGFPIIGGHLDIMILIIAALATVPAAIAALRLYLGRRRPVADEG